MKYITGLVCLLLSINAFATDIFSFELQKHQKLEKTLSVDISSSATLHMVIVKNKDSKMYDLIPFFLDENMAVKQMETASFEEVPDLISYHMNGSIITLVSHQDETLDILDFDIDIGSLRKVSRNNIEKPEAVFIEDSVSVLLSADRKGETLNLVTITSGEQIVDNNIKVSEDLHRKIKKMFKNVEAVNTNEYVKNGSISASQAYLNQGIIYLINDDIESDLLEAITIDPSAADPVTVRDYSTDALDKTKKSNTHVEGNKLFSVLLNKEDVKLSIFDLDSGNVEKSMLLSEELSAEKTINSRKGKFLKEANKFKMKATVSVNRTKNNNFEITLDYVDPAKYKYNNNWFWFHQMMFQQHMMMNTVPMGFGPNPETYDEIALLASVVGTSDISFVLDSKWNLIPGAVEETKHQYVDKEQYLESLAKNKNVYNQSAGFLQDEYRYIYSDKKGDVIFIKSRPIKRRSTVRK
ncbi:hypothetical protein [Constantimarinum furrinae]|uniref:AMIN domain-containing protein n=1 Tax=Constantimarinum furrinae TaxID=2562285 RepID=A0A7G8PVE4_9FLAO|nr:hypothetical protein [Constantimarinum furrinae]QNJ98310.1 hypothetical protein ALE3EI_1759 [Constantimarinum furrinae]